jgi:hypothetical protein
MNPSAGRIPMKRHKRLFIVLLLGWIAWCGVMVALYYTTVRPHVQLDSPKPQTTQAALG